MKITFCLIFLSIFAVTYSTESADSTKSKLKANCTFSLNSNGIASIPSFSLGKPAIMASLSLAKGRFSYEPVLAYGFNLKPWVIDNWFHYKIIDRPSFELRTGVDISSFFSEYKLPDATILQGQRYYTFELTGVYKPSAKSFVSVAYWNDRGQDEGTIKGHFISLMGERSEINIGKNVLLSANIHLFNVSYYGDNDGLFVSPKISATMRNVPFVIFFHVIQAITSNISPFPGFRWNLGLSYTLKT
jgi:hypothetical protein